MTHIFGKVILLQDPHDRSPVATGAGLTYALQLLAPLPPLSPYVSHFVIRSLTVANPVINQDGEFDAGDLDTTVDSHNTHGSVYMTLTIDGADFHARVYPPQVADPGLIQPVFFPQALPVETVNLIMLQQQQAKYRWGDHNDNRPGYCGSTFPFMDTNKANYQAIRTKADAPALANGLYMATHGPVDPLAEADFSKLNGDPSFQNIAHTKSFRNDGNPRGASARNDDKAFAAQRVAGINPLVIVRADDKTPSLKSPPFTPPPSIPHKGGGVKPMPDWLPVGPQPWRARFQAAFGLSVDAAVAAGRLYVCIYTALLGGISADPSKPPTPNRAFVAPIAVFLAQDATLVPAGIFLGGAPDLHANPVFMPGDANWEVAKLAVQSADLNAHEMKSHLHDTHLVMEAMAVAMYRNLPLSHPVAKLLNEHFHSMLHQGWFARTALMSSGQVVDTSLGTGLAGAWKIVENAHRQWRFDHAGLEQDLGVQGRNMADAAIVYPYRDDARDVLAAIAGFVGPYLAGAYPGGTAAADHSVASDTTLQGWIAEAGDPQRGNLQGLSAPTTLAALTAMASQIIFTCTAQHSALNYPQYDYFGQITNMPAALWHEPHLDAAGNAPDFLSLLPKKQLAVGQIDLAFQLSNLQYDKIGDYAPRFATALAGSLDAFRNALNDAEARITARDAARRATLPALHYPYLMPSLILQSISI